MIERVIVCLLKNEPATYRMWQVKGETRSQSESEPQLGVSHIL